MTDRLSKAAYPQVWKRPRLCVTCNEPRWVQVGDRAPYLLGLPCFLSSTPVTGAGVRSTSSSSVDSPPITSKCSIPWSQFPNDSVCWAHGNLSNRLPIQKSYIWFPGSCLLSAMGQPLDEALYKSLLIQSCQQHNEGNVPISILTLEKKQKEVKPSSLNFQAGALTSCNPALSNITQHLISFVQTTNCFQMTWARMPANVEAHEGFLD